ncbi:MAG TPA: SAM-dependent chlorinase/fluorinase, partial [Holophaga sp.]|nr:SAM-dependent chlorinase/fluorinase [Holophaga sp.]
MGPIITLLTDFGRIDPYAGILHGVIACIAPEARIIDLSHDIPPQDVAAASFCLACAVPCFPDGTIHVAVVDPGVGTARRAVALAVEGGFLVGPDNGLFTGVLARTRILAGVALDDPARWRTPQPSPVFHGRDIFAPAAAHLAHGIPLDGLGTPLDPAGLVRLDLPRCVRQGDRIQGCVQHVDQFGNLVT